MRSKGGASRQEERVHPWAESQTRGRGCGRSSAGDGSSLGPRPWTLLKTHPLGLAGNLRWRLTQGTGFWRPSATVPPEGVLSKAPRPGPGSDKPPLRWHLSSSLPTVDSSTARHCTSRQRTHLKGQGCFRRARGRGESGGERQ